MIALNPLNPQNSGTVPATRKINGKALAADITLAAADVGARPSTWTPTAADIGALQTAYMNTNDISLEGIAQLAKSGAFRFGVINWDSPNAPDNNNTIVLMASWTVVAISFTGKIFSLDLNTNKWIAR